MLDAGCFISPVRRRTTIHFAHCVRSVAATRRKSQTFLPYEMLIDLYLIDKIAQRPDRKLRIFH